MKAVVVAIRGGFAAVLSDDGRIVKVKNRNYSLGQITERKEAVKKRFRFVSAAAAAVFVCGAAGAGVYAYCTPYSYVSLDADPSVEYCLNRFDRVLQITGVNDSGKKIADELQADGLNNEKIEDAVARTVEKIEKEGLSKGNQKSDIVISTSAKDPKKAEKMAEGLKQSTKNTAEGKGAAVEAFPVGLDQVKEAHKLGVTPGKLDLAEKLRDNAQSPDDTDLQKWLNKPVPEILKKIRENGEAEKTEEKPLKESSSSQGGSSSRPSSEKGTGKTGQMPSIPESQAAKTESRSVEKQEKESGNLKKRNPSLDRKTKNPGAKLRDKRKQERESGGRKNFIQKKNKDEKKIRKAK
ncbi:putative RsgI N-terminal anti-sigma domain-containing protein [Ruminococcaceae bacterium BL-6]|nr:putative RsgI N-terminal anti-sigma domain-containing protein [Ruminococcaceae bacterium BL-6]